ncbi:Hypothetical protein GbCGDNIH2_0501 [Granulibacter bethesdensis]|nr:Hypothetical protein GbCGDNIH2_0501 [Granulibacter bethesdensis]
MDRYMWLSRMMLRWKALIALGALMGAWGIMIQVGYAHKPLSHPPVHAQPAATCVARALDGGQRREFTRAPVQPPGTLTDPEAPRPVYRLTSHCYPDLQAEAACPTEYGPDAHLAEWFDIAPLLAENAEAAQALGFAIGDLAWLSVSHFSYDKGMQYYLTRLDTPPPEDALIRQTAPHGWIVGQWTGLALPSLCEIGTRPLPAPQE